VPNTLSRRDVLKGIGASAATGLFLAACAPTTGETGATAGSAPADEAITIEWWTINLKSTFGEIMQSYIDEYEAANPNVTIEWVDVPGNEVAQKYATALAGGNAPDAANIYEMARFIENQAVLALDDLVPEEDQEAFGGFWEAGAIGGNHYAIPWYTSFARPVVVNGNLANAAGVDLSAPPATWQEVFEIGRGAQDAWSAGVYPWVDCWDPKSWSFEEGLEVISADGQEATVNTPEWAAHMETILALREEGLLSPDAYACPNPRVAIDWFWQGLGAFINSGPYIINRTQVEVLEDGQYDVIPTIVGSANRIALDPQIFVIAKDSEHPEVAVDFVLSVVRPENFIPFAQAVAIAPAYLPALEDPFFTEPPEEEPADYQQMLIRKAIDIGVADLQRVEIEPLSKPFFYWTTIAEEVPQRVANDELAMVEGNLSVEEFLARWEEEINAAIQEALEAGTS